MCGINGFVLNQKNENARSFIKAMNNTIIHRGPDGDGVFTADNRVALGMRRLAIIDLSTGNQPMYSKGGSLVIVFNGEIYNYKELKKAFIEKGITFYTDSDTEVILKGYEIYGKEIVRHLNGMFAFAIYDSKEQEIFIARDRVGEKPLYYCPDKDFFTFSSELKSIKKLFETTNKEISTISKKALQLYFTLTFIPAPYTIYENVYKLQPGSYLVLNTNTNEYSITQYWDVAINKQDELIEDYKEAKRQLHELLYDSVEQRMISDVPIGVFLSGGIDSSIITAIMADLRPTEKIKTFSVVSNQLEYDESTRSNAVAKHCNTDHHSILFEFGDLRNHLEEVVLNYDEPFADSSALATFWVAKKTREYVTVALTGDGGDEVFGGYNRYLMSYYSNLYRKIVPNYLHKKIIKPFINNVNQNRNELSRFAHYQKLINSIGESEFSDLVNVMSLGFSENEKRLLLKKEYYEDSNGTFFESHYDRVKNKSSLLKARYLDKNISLEGDMLVKVDRASMLTSLECRSPLLDHRLFEFSNLLPDSFLLNGKDKKRILKDTFRHLVPTGLFDMPKKGFAIPIGLWLRKHLQNEIMTLSEKEFLIAQKIFEPEYIQTILKEHFSENKNHTYKVWTYYCFQKWYINNF